HCAEPASGRHRRQAHRQSAGADSRAVARRRRVGARRRSARRGARELSAVRIALHARADEAGPHRHLRPARRGDELLRLVPAACGGAASGHARYRRDAAIKTPRGGGACGIDVARPAPRFDHFLAVGFASEALDSAAFAAFFSSLAFFASAADAALAALAAFASAADAAFAALAASRLDSFTFFVSAWTADAAAAVGVADAAVAVRLTAGFSSFFAAVAACALPLKAAPLTVSPSAENLAALLSPTPLTRSIMSFQSLNGAFLRSSRILVAIAGPMPLTASSSAWLALLTSTAAAKATAAKKAIKMATRVLNMSLPLQ